MVMLSFFSFYRYLYYRPYDRFPSDEAKSEVLLRSMDFPTRWRFTAGNAQGIGGAWWFCIMERGTQRGTSRVLSRNGTRARER